MTELIEKILTDEQTATHLSASPQQFLREAGLDSSPFTLGDRNIALLGALAHPAVRNALTRGNYTEVFSYLEAAGAISTISEDALTAEIEEILVRDKMEVRAALGLREGQALDLKTTSELIQGSHQAPTRLDIAILSESIRRSPSRAPAIGAFALVVAAAAVWAAVYVAVALWATVRVASHMKFSTNGAITRPLRFADTPPFPGGRISPINAAIRERMIIGTKLSELTEDTRVLDWLESSSAESEMKAILLALRNTGILNFDPDDTDALISLCSTFAQRAVAGTQP